MTKNFCMLFSVVLAVTWATGASAGGGDGNQTGARLGFDTPTPTLNLVPSRSVLLDDKLPWRQAEAARCIEGFLPSDACRSAAERAGGYVGLGEHAHAGPSAAAGAKLGGVIAVLEGAGALLEDK